MVSRHIPPSLPVSISLNNTAIDQPRPPNLAGKTLAPPPASQLAHLTLTHPEHLGRPSRANLVMA
jgi:hypothetical protein